MCFYSKPKLLEGFINRDLVSKQSGRNVPLAGRALPVEKHSYQEVLRSVTWLFYEAQGSGALWH